MISISKKLGLLLLAALSMALTAGCNDTLRQFIVPVPKPNGDPGNLAHAVVLSTNGTANGSTRHIDVSGDSPVGDFPTGVNPVFLGKAAGRTFIINGDGTLTSYAVPFLTTPTINTVTLPTTTPPAKPVAGGTSSNNNFYLADSGSNDLSQVSGSVLAVTQAIPVGTGPVAVAGNAGNSKMYVVNNGSDSVSVISTTDNTLLKNIQFPVGSHPIWGVMANNGIQVFIVNQGNPTATPPVPGSVSVIDTNLDIPIPCTPGPTSCDPKTGAISVGINPAISSPNFAFYESTSQRLYVSNTGENSISVIKADGISLGPPQTLPGLLKNIPTSGPPVSVVALADGSKAYAVLGGCPAGTNHTNLINNLANCKDNRVSIIDAKSLVELKTVQVGAGPVSVDAASDSSRVYVASAQDTIVVHDNMHNPSCTAAPCGVGGPCTALPCSPGSPLPDRSFPASSVSIIRTATDSVFTPAAPPDPTETVAPFSFRMLQQDPNCVPAFDLQFNKNIPLPCPLQQAFMVRVFP